MNRTFTTVDWDRYATIYDTLLELHPYLAMLEDVCGMLREIRSPVLDTGCGTGNLTSMVARTGTTVVGIDASYTMLRYAKDKCPRIGFAMADLESGLPFRTSTFDAVTCVNALYAVADPAYVLAEFARVLQPGGMLIVVTPANDYENGLILKSHCKSPKPNSYWLDAHQGAEREAMLIREAFIHEGVRDRFLEIAKINRALAQEHSFHFLTAHKLTQMVRRSGFVRIRVGRTYANQNLLLTGRKALTCASR